MRKKFLKVVQASMIGVALMATVSVAKAAYVDVGFDCVYELPSYLQSVSVSSNDTILKYAKQSLSGIPFGNAIDTITLSEGADQLTITSSGSIGKQGNMKDVYINSGNATLATASLKVVWDSTTLNTYVEASRSAGGSAIETIMLNGVANAATATVRAKLTVLFSDSESFDPESVIGYQQVEFPGIRYGVPAKTVTAPAGTKSFRLYNNVSLQQVDAKYKVVAHRTGDILLTNDGTKNEIRLAYIGVGSAVRSVSIQPVPYLTKDSTKQLSADLLTYGTADNTVTWEVLGAVDATNTKIDVNGLLTVGAKETETAASLKVVATSTFDVSVTDTITFPIYDDAAVVNSVAVTPTSKNLKQGELGRFVVSVDAANGAEETVTWSTNSTDPATVFVVDADTVTLSISLNEPLTSLELTATSTFDSIKKAVATIAVEHLAPEVLSVSIAPVAVNVGRDTSVQFAATVVGQGGASTAITWSLNGSQLSTIDQTGKLTVAADETNATFTVIATSTATPTVKGEATIMVSGIPVSENFVDWGVNLINDNHALYGCGDKAIAGTLIAYAHSGVAPRTDPKAADAPETATLSDVMYAGTDREMTVTVEGIKTQAAIAASEPDNGRLLWERGNAGGAYAFYLKRGATPNQAADKVWISHFRMTGADGFFTMELSGTAAAERTIESVTINGTSTNAQHIAGVKGENGAPEAHCYPSGKPEVRVRATVLFSDKAPFDGSSIIGYDSVSLAPSRDGDLAQTVAAKEGTKSFRVYHTVKLTADGEKFRVNPNGNIVLTVDTALPGDDQIRLGYIAATLVGLNAPVLSVSVNPATVTVMKNLPQGFTAEVVTDGPGRKNVKWSISGNNSNTTAITSSGATTGLLTVAADETAATITVTATSIVDTTKFGTATVTVAGNSSNTAIGENSFQPLQVYPNPVVDGLLIVSCEQLNASDKIELYTMVGKLVAVYPVSQPTTTLNLSQLPHGQYIVKAGNRSTIIVVGTK